MKNNKIVKAVCMLLVLTAFALMAIGSGSDDGGASKVGEVTDEKGNAVTDENGEKVTVKLPEKVTESTQTEFSVGETLITKSLKVIYLSSGVFESDNEFIQPAEGKQYVYIRLYCENIGSSDESVNVFEFECYADGYSCEACYSMDEELSASLSAGRNTVGTVCFEVPVGAEKIEFEYKPNLFGDTKYVFRYEGVKDGGITPPAVSGETEGAFRVGDIVETKKERISFLSCGEYTSDNMFIQPKEGCRFVYFEFEFENVSDSDTSVSTIDFHCYANGSACESHYFDEDMLSGTLSPGRKAKGCVYFEVPVDATVIEAEYEENLFTSKKVVFRYSD